MPLYPANLLLLLYMCMHTYTCLCVCVCVCDFRQYPMMQPSWPQTHSAAEAGPEFLIFLPACCTCWDPKHVSLWTAEYLPIICLFVCLFVDRVSSTLGWQWGWDWTSDSPASTFLVPQLQVCAITLGGSAEYQTQDFVHGRAITLPTGEYQQSPF